MAGRRSPTGTLLSHAFGQTDPLDAAPFATKRNMTAPITDTPVPGFYWTRLVRGGPKVPVRIWLDDNCRDPDTGEPMDRPPMMRATRGGKEVDLSQVWPYCAKHCINAAEYLFLEADAKHAQRYRPDEPEARPDEPVDLNQIEPIF